MPEVSAEVSPRDWVLSAAGVAAARRLRLPEGARLVASDERKAVQTLEAACPGVEVAVDAGFGEVRRPDEWVDDHRARARAYVEGVRHAGWEAHAEVVARFSAAVRRHAGGEAVLVIGTHGMAATLWLAAAGRVPDPGVFWAELRFPDVMEAG